MTSCCYLGVDVGTSSTKGVIVDDGGRIVATATRGHSVDRPAPGQVEMDASTWWAEFVSVARELTDAARAEGLVVEAVGPSGMGPCVALADAQGTPVRAAILYGVDTRSGPQIESLTSALGAERIVDVGGTALSSQAAGPKIRWIAENEPEEYARARMLFMPSSFVAWKLTGEYILDHHSASQCWPMYDLRSATWHDDHFEAAAGGLQRPRLAWPGQPVGMVTAAAAALTGIPSGATVVAGSIDAWTEAVSVDAASPGDLLLMYGTTMFLVATVATPEARSPSMWTTSGVCASTWALAGGMATSGAITAWIDELWGAESAPGFEVLTQEASLSGAGARGLVMLPYFAGERTPRMDPDARGAILGLTLTHGRGDLYRAALEATAFGVRHNLETMAEAGVVPERIVVAGGGAASDLWLQIVSDVTGVRQSVPAHTIGASLGAAMLAAKSIGAGSRPAAWNPVVRHVTPDDSLRGLYSDLYAMYLDLYDGTSAVQHRLALLQAAETAL